MLDGGDPAAGEKVYVAVMDRAGAPRLVDTRVAKIVQDPNGTAFTLEAKDKFTTGAAVFDTQGRLVGLVNRDGNAAWSATRIESARERQRPAS